MQFLSVMSALMKLRLITMWDSGIEVRVRGQNGKYALPKRFQEPEEVTHLVKNDLYFVPQNLQNDLYFQKCNLFL